MQTPSTNTTDLTACNKMLANLLWVGINGEIRCIRHAGYSLWSEASERPLAVQHFTDNNHWIRTDADIFAGELDDFECEDC